jgi:protein-L-isoaspartate(D-aspartate) O-methyltransferase
MNKLLLILAVLILLTACSKQIEKQQSNGAEEYSQLRSDMVEKQIATRDISDDDVIASMKKVPRHLFVPEEIVDKAYNDRPLPIGYGQTISQPYIVALMTQEIEVDKDDKVLEIGTGSGYQAAVLSELVSEVYTIEIIKELATAAEERLQELGYENIAVKNADGYFGWEEHAPYDAIIITAAANHIPPPLLQQLKNNGKLIIPLGSTLQFQTLTLVTKKDGNYTSEFITGVRFVPLTGKALES